MAAAGFSDKGAGVLDRASSDTELRTYVVTHIDEAIENGWVKPYYQPVIRTLTGKLCGFEALARWEDPTYGLLAPADFIPVLEETKLVHLLDCSIILQTCKRISDARNVHVPAVPISFNLSRLDFSLCDMFSVVENAVREYGVPRHLLNIEITESILGSDPEFMTNMLRTFHDAGYEVWMDDFGSGYSTLNVLKDFEFDELKIDMEFLSSFNEKSKAIIASVVDMSKKLGIHTLAEGVETVEHRDFLCSIGCEKMQGFLFGEPMPYDPDDPFACLGGFDVEKVSDYQYANEIGAVNTLSLSEHDLTENNTARSYMTNMPIALVEYSNNTYKVIEANDAFRENLARLGIPSIEAAELLANDPTRPFGRQTKRMMQSIEKDKYARFDYVAGNSVCVVRARHITTHNGKIAIIMSFGDTVAQSDQRRHDRMSELLGVVYSIYDLVGVMHLEERYFEPVFDNLGWVERKEARDFDALLNLFAQTDVYEDDRERFVEFMDYETMVERVANGNENYLSGFFRVHQTGGNYIWKLFTLFPLPNEEAGQVLLCVRSTHWKSDELLHRAFGKHQDDGEDDLDHPESDITDGSLWRALARGGFTRLFWKDTNRRFVGANQAFLDYYGFTSVDDIIGKTDEDMGWHIDPTPFQQDELHVLRDGISIESAHGYCIMHGENRNIAANKYPVYRNGHIVGLVGCFLDETDTSALPVRDEVTDLLNFTGLEAATWKYVDAYKRQDIDFAMISVNIENFDLIRSALGNPFGNKVLKRVADTLLGIVGRQSVVGYVFAGRFVILEQTFTDEELQGICDDIEHAIMGIAQIDGTPCTVFALAEFSRFSEYGDIDAMKRHNRDMRFQRRKTLSGGFEEEDIPSLFAQ